MCFHRLLLLVLFDVFISTTQTKCVHFDQKNVVESVKVTVLFNSISFADFVDTKATGKKTLA